MRDMARVGAARRPSGGAAWHAAGLLPGRWRLLSRVPAGAGAPAPAACLRRPAVADCAGPFHEARWFPTQLLQVTGLSGKSIEIGSIRVFQRQRPPEAKLCCPLGGNVTGTAAPADPAGGRGTDGVVPSGGWLLVGRRADSATVVAESGAAVRVQPPTLRPAAQHV